MHTTHAMSVRQVNAMLSAECRKTAPDSMQAPAHSWQSCRPAWQQTREVAAARHFATCLPAQTYMTTKHTANSHAVLHHARMTANAPIMCACTMSSTMPAHCPSVPPPDRGHQPSQSWQVPAPLHVTSCLWSSKQPCHLVFLLPPINPFHLLSIGSFYKPQVLEAKEVDDMVAELCTLSGPVRLVGPVQDLLPVSSRMHAPCWPCTSIHCDTTPFRCCIWKLWRCTPWCVCACFQDSLLSTVCCWCSCCMLQPESQLLLLVSSATLLWLSSQLAPATELVTACFAILPIMMYCLSCCTACCMYCLFRVLPA